MQGDLTDLATVRAWVGIATAPSPSDDLLSRLITAASRFVLNAINQSAFGKRSIVNTVDGNDKNWLVLREWPVLSVEQVQVQGQPPVTQQSTFGQTYSPGIELEEAAPGSSQQRLTAHGSHFHRGRANIRINYTVGYFVDGEAAFIPTSAPYQVNPQQFWESDGGVTYANGSALTLVGSNPAQGQYAITDGQYVFSAADAGQGVMISYSYVPADIVQAVTELVGERFKSKDRIGVTGQTLAGKESVTYFSQKDMNAFVNSALQPYRRVTPA